MGLQRADEFSPPKADQVLLSHIALENFVEFLQELVELVDMDAQGIDVDGIGDQLAGGLLVGEIFHQVVNQVGQDVPVFLLLLEIVVGIPLFFK